MSEWKLNGGLTAAGVKQETMKMSVVLACASLLGAASLGAETKQERGKRSSRRRSPRMGGDKFLEMKDRVETGRAYSFYRDRLTGLSIAKIYTRYLETPAANGLARARTELVRQGRRLLRVVHGRRWICGDVSRRAADADGSVHALGGSDEPECLLHPEESAEGTRTASRIAGSYRFGRTRRSRS